MNRFRAWTRGRNPARRPRGSKRRLAESFIPAFYDDWSLREASVIAKVRQELPADCLKIAAPFLPKGLRVQSGSLST